MKKFIDTPDSLLTSSLAGFAKVHADIIRLHQQPTYICRAQAKTEKVILVSGGGSGHEPLHSGLVGYGMLDAACPGQIFTSPTPDQMLAAAQDLACEAGVLFIVKNYAGDIMSFEMAADMLTTTNATLIVADDISLPKNHSIGRRGVAGTLIVEKIVGAAAEKGYDLDTCLAIGQKVSGATASIGLALTSCTVPALGKPTFLLGADEIEFGVGIHGEHGRETCKWQVASVLVNKLSEELLNELKPQPKQEILLHVNGFGATPLLELYSVYELASQFWQKYGINIKRSLVGNYTTSLDMAGCSLTITLLDEELLHLWDAPVHTAALRW